MQSKMGILSFLSFSHFKKKSFFFLKICMIRAKEKKKKQGSLVWIKIKAIHTCVSLTFLEVNRYLFCSLICVKMLAIWGQVEWGRGHKCWATRPRGVANDSFCSQNGGCMAHFGKNMFPGIKQTEVLPWLNWVLSGPCNLSGLQLLCKTRILTSSYQNCKD